MLLANDLLDSTAIEFFVDGARTLHAAITEHFAGWLRQPVRLILDWYHLRKKCAELLSRALRGRHRRNAVLDDLLPFLWLGNVDEAIAYLRDVPEGHVKSADRLAQLQAYLDRNRKHIPCYALRHALDLRNSSNLGEKANDLVVATRQKHHGMSWSRRGSVALATLTAVHRNTGLENWCRDRTVSFRLVA